MYSLHNGQAGPYKVGPIMKPCIKLWGFCFFYYICILIFNIMAKKQTKVGKVMHEFKHGTLHSGSKKGPKVKTREQAIAIALSEERKGKK